MRTVDHNAVKWRCVRILLRRQNWRVRKKERGKRDMERDDIKRDVER